MASLKEYDLKNIADLPLKIQFVVAGILCALVFYFGYLWDISGLQKELHAVRSQEQDFKSQFQAIANSLTNLQHDLSQLPQIRAAIEKWQTKLIKSPNLPDLLNEILKIGTNNQLQFDLFSPAPAIKESFYLRVPITAVAIGNYHQIANFFSQIANMPTIVVIDNYQIARPEGRLVDKKLSSQPGYANQLKAQFVLNVYTLPEKESTTATQPSILPKTTGVKPNAP